MTVVPEGRSARPGRDAGFTLIIVLVALVSLAGLTTSLMLLSKDASLTARVIERQALARVLEASAIARLRSALSDPSDTFEADLANARGVVTARFSAVPVTLTLEREGSKIDPRSTNREVLTRYLATVSPALTTGVVERLRSARGWPELRRRLLETLLPHIPFEQVARDFTVWGEGAAIDPTGASVAVLAAIPDIGVALARRIVDQPGLLAQGTRPASAFFGPPSRRFSLRIAIDWAPNETWVRRVPFEVTASGQPLRLSGRL